jgi:hypothetical protein
MARKLVRGLDPRSGCWYTLLRPERGNRSETYGEYSERNEARE